MEHINIGNQLLLHQHLVLKLRELLILGLKQQVQILPYTTIAIS